MFENGVPSVEGNFMHISVSVCLLGSEQVSSSMHYGEYLNLLMYFIRDLASINYYYDFTRKCIYSFDDTDIGLQPASGLKSPVLSEAEIEEELHGRIKRNQLLSTRNISYKETKAVRRKACAIFYL